MARLTVEAGSETQLHLDACFSEYGGRGGDYYSLVGEHFAQNR